MMSIGEQKQFSIENDALALLGGPPITGSNGFEISLALIFTHVTALRFGLPVI